MAHRCMQTRFRFSRHLLYRLLNGRATRYSSHMAAARLHNTQACSTTELEGTLEGAEMETSAHEAQTWSLSSQSHLAGVRVRVRVGVGGLGLGLGLELGIGLGLESLAVPPPLEHVRTRPQRGRDAHPVDHLEVRQQRAAVAVARAPAHVLSRPASSVDLVPAARLDRWIDR